jgi:hypothetical protein
MLKRIRLALPTIIVVRRDTLKRNVIVYIRTRSLS